MHITAPERLSVHGPEEPSRGDFTLYWISAAVRTQDNEALECAISRAKTVGQSGSWSTRPIPMHSVEPHYDKYSALPEVPGRRWPNTATIRGIT